MNATTTSIGILLSSSHTQVWWCFSNLNRFIPNAVNTMSNFSFDNKTRGRAVRFCSHLACNKVDPSSHTIPLHVNNILVFCQTIHPHLMADGAIFALLEIARSCNPTLGSSSACVAVSVLAGESVVIKSGQLPMVPRTCLGSFPP